MDFMADQFDRASTPSVLGGRPSIVLLATAFQILGDPSVKRAIGAPHDIHEPFVTGRTSLWLAGFFRHAAKLPGIRLADCAAQE